MVEIKVNSRPVIIPNLISFIRGILETTRLIDYPLRESRYRFMRVLLFGPQWYDLFGSSCLAGIGTTTEPGYVNSIDKSLTASGRFNIGKGNKWT